MYKLRRIRLLFWLTIFQALQTFSFIFLVTSLVIFREDILGNFYWTMTPLLMYLSSRVVTMSQGWMGIWYASSAENDLDEYNSLIQESKYIKYGDMKKVYINAILFSGLIYSPIITYIHYKKTGYSKNQAKSAVTNFIIANINTILTSEQKLSMKNYFNTAKKMEQLSVVSEKQINEYIFINAVKIFNHEIDIFEDVASKYIDEILKQEFNKNELSSL